MSVLESFPERKGQSTLSLKKYLFDIARHVRTTFFNGRIHFGNAWRYVLGEVVQKEPADVEECLWHVGTEGLILEIKESLKERIKNMFTHIWVAWIYLTPSIISTLLLHCFISKSGQEPFTVPHHKLH